MKILMGLMLLSGIVFAKPWTVAVFINADNSLNSYADLDIAEMRKMGGSNDFVDIVAMVDKSKYGDSKYIHVGKTAAEDEVEVKSEINSGDYKEVVKFVQWANEKYPSDKLMLVLWNHGSGAIKTRGFFEVLDISFDDSSNSVIKTSDIHKIFEEILPIKVEVLGYDACLQQMIEVLYESKDYVNYVVSSEESEPAEGWDYSMMFPAIENKLDSGEFVTAIVDSYMAFYESAGKDVTMSAIDMKKFNEFLPLFREWSINVDVQAFKAAKKNATSFAVYDYKDLGEVLKATASPEVLAAYEAMMIKAAGSGEYANVTGLSAYLPNYKVSKKYEELDFSKDFVEYLALLKK